MGSRKFVQSVAVALIVGLMSIGADAGATAKPKKRAKKHRCRPRRISKTYM